jgi:predicted DNA-binding transcriptional regulator YafY
VGQRSPTDTLAGIYQSFLAHHTWKQAELAREVEVRPATLHKILTQLQSQGMPLTCEKEHPHVFWSVPPHWFPGSVFFKQEEVPELLRQLRRVPDGRSRAKLLALLLERLPRSTAALGPSSASAPVVVPPAASPDEERHLAMVEDAANQRTTLHMRYLSAGRVDESRRYASVHRVLLGPPARFVGTCHRDGKLKTFRVDGILDASLDAREGYRAKEDAVIERYLAESVDGFHDEGPPVELSFVVRDPEARWVKKNLLDGMRAETIPRGIRVTAHTAALRRIAQYVVGLGAAATPETAALAKEVTTLAQGALQAIAVAALDAERSPSRS